MITLALGLLTLAIFFCVGSYLIRHSPASVPTLPEAGGSRGRLASSPGQVRAVPPSLILLQGPDAGLIGMSGRGRTLDYLCAETVDVTITDREVWVEVDGENVFRVKRSKSVPQVEDFRTLTVETRQ